MKKKETAQKRRIRADEVKERIKSQGQDRQSTKRRKEIWRKEKWEGK
jgi:hypothetical protein